MTSLHMKSEKQKMLEGLPYKAMDDELVNDRLHIRELIFEFNNLHPADSEQRIQIIKKSFGGTGRKIYIEPPFHCDYGYNIFAGESFYANFNLTILDCAKVTIGNNVLIAPNVSLFTAGHPLHPSSRANELEYAFPITIGDNVWIGGNVVINPGIKIGDNTVIGSGSVVTKDIPSLVIAAGNPCRVIRNITEEDKKYYFKNLRFQE